MAEAGPAPTTDEEPVSNPPVEPERLVVVSNRLPVRLNRDPASGEWRISGSSGGLVTAMAPVLSDRGGMWIGWTGTVAEEKVELGKLLPQVSRDLGYDLRAVELTAQERDDFYLGFSNAVVWPLFHDLLTMYNFDPDYWQAYRTVNRRYAEAIVRHARPDDYIWIHDYHLMGVAGFLREMGFEGRVGFFLHTPFPAPDIYLKLPWRAEILAGLLAYDLVGFQTLRDRRNFLHCVRTLLADVPVSGSGAVVTCRLRGREIRVGSFPISIDFHEFEQLAGSPEVTARVEEIQHAVPGRRFMLGVDRLDYTKGIPYRLEAFHRAVKCYPELRRRVTLVQVVVPSREDIPEYNELKEEIERLVGRINGEWTESGWVPIHYIYRSVPRPELLARYRSAEVALVTPLKDGMNLVAKEFCAAHVDRAGTLILSEFAGAADQLQDGALLVNPYDIEGMAEAIRRAFAMTEEERSKQMRRLRGAIREQDIFWWVRLFFRAALEDPLGEFPTLRVYTPRPATGGARGAKRRRALTRL